MVVAADGRWRALAKDRRRGKGREGGMGLAGLGRRGRAWWMEWGFLVLEEWVG